MTDSPTERLPSPRSPSDDLFLGETTGVVFVFHHTHGFIHTDHFGSIFVHESGLVEGIHRLEPGQRVSARILQGTRGRYAHHVQVLATSAAPASGDAPPDPLSHPPSRKLIAHIANRLRERNPNAIIQISRLYQHFGSDIIGEIVAETERIEAEGGMLLPDGSRRRTPGGVFFLQARKRLAPGEWERIFPQKSWKEQRKQNKTTQGSATTPQGAPAPAPTPLIVTWEMRGPLVDEAKACQGRATSVKVTVIGRPTSVVERGNTVILMLTHSGPLPSLPKGVPTPTVVPTTTYTVYVAAKQWRGVAEAIKNPEDVLIIEGAQTWDAEQQAIAVYTTKIATKLQQRAKRPAPPTEPTTPA
jgi:cold shock CspA family protein